MDCKPTICALMLGSPAVAVTGDPTFLASLRQSRHECEAIVPGLHLAEGADLPSGCPHLEFCTAPAPRCMEQSPGTTVHLEGDPILFTPAVWADLLLTRSAQAVENRGWFLIEAGAVLVNGKAILLAGPPGSGQAAAALQLGIEGHPVLAAEMCLVDTSMRLLAGTSRFRLARYFLHKHFPWLSNCPSSLSPLSPVWLDDPRVPTVRAVGAAGRGVELGGVCHLHLQESPSPLRPVAEAKSRMVLSSHLVSWPVCRPAVIGPWKLILPQHREPGGEGQRRAAIVALSALPHVRVYGRIADLSLQFQEQFHVPTG